MFVRYGPPIATALDPGELGAITSVARRFGIAWFIGSALSVDGRITSLGVGVVLALAAYSKATHLVHDRLVRVQCHALMAMWAVAGGAAAWDLATGTTADGPLILGLVSAGTLAVFGMWSLAGVVERTDPPPGVRRWTTIAQASAVVLFGVAAAAAGAHAVTEEVVFEGRARTMVGAFVLTPALFGLVLGYGSAIGQLMRTAGHPLAPRQFDGETTTTS